MRKVISLGVVVAVALATGCGRNKTLVRVGGEAITESDLSVLGEVNPRLKPRLATPVGKQKILENYVEQTLFYREATRRGIDRQGLTKEKLNLYKKIIIAQALLDDELNKKVKEYYDNHKDEFERVKVSHLLIRTVTAGAEGNPKAKQKQPVVKRSEAEAQRLITKVQERLKKGEDFFKVAAELSEDDQTKKNEGSLGYVTIHDKRLERWGWLPLAEHAFAMNEGDVSEPIKTKDGFHIVKVVEGKKLQPVEESDPGIRFRIQPDIRTALLEELKKKYKVVYAEPKESAASMAPAAVQEGGAPEVPAQVPAVPAPAVPGPVAPGPAAPKTP